MDTGEWWGQPGYPSSRSQRQGSCLSTGRLTSAQRALRASCQGQECKNDTASAGGNPGPGAAEISVSCVQGPRPRRPRRPRDCCPSAHQAPPAASANPPPQGPISTRPRPRPRLFQTTPPPGPAPARPRPRQPHSKVPPPPGPAPFRLHKAPPTPRPRPLQTPPPASPLRPLAGHTCPGSPPQSPAPMFPPDTPPPTPPTL